ncbi:LysR family transcriptional regulator ArgP [Microbacterium aurantiacum]|uniref:Chromosome replication initiation inhibitor protein n=1 Tax=Microbacterium aurantiacum TaxID=162393 RepID=A0A0N0RRD6_9MICO|nr:LysR family transcriptional regulator ArgP [Microbacterium chocolatum]ANG84033.1 transcriptional regulator ArgP [Microbacterium chocolatum]KOS10479.1 chromosome replication initiation inhibitor protein [Microbacterium chocolatum]
MRIPFDLAETVALVVAEGTFDAAAARLHITPSAVSQRVRTLEDLVGQVLLVRSKPVRATAAGEAIVRLARQAAQLETDARAALGIGADETASVALAVNADSLATWFLPPLARLTERHGVVFEIHRDDQDFTAGLLETGAVLGAVTSQRRPVPGCRVTALGSMRYRAVAAPSYAARWLPDGADAGTLERAPIVDFDRRDELQRTWLRSHGVVSAPPRHLVPASHDFATAVLLGLGWALLPTFQADDALARGDLVALGGEDVEVPLYWQQWNLRSPLLDAVAEEIIGEARRALDPPSPDAVSRR